MDFDIARARADTPGTENVLHFNNAGAALPPTAVLDSVVGHLQLEAAIGGYEANDRALAAREHTYDAIAALLNAQRDEIAIVENATVAWLMAFHALIRDCRPGDKILTVEAEYAANYISYLQVAREKGLEVHVVPSDEAGSVDLAAMEQMIDERVKLISVTHVPTNGGLVNPAAAIGKIARRAGVRYLLDACQSAGQIPLDVDAIGCDALSVTGRKYLRGPRGTGFLYVRHDLIADLTPPMIDLAAARWVAADRYELLPTARRFENWEFNVAGMIGLGVAIDYALSWGVDAIHERVTALAEMLRQRLSAVPGVTVTDIGHEKCGIVTFMKAGVAPLDIKAALAAQGINVSVSDVHSTRIDMERRGLEKIVRASVHYYNTDAEIDRFCDAIECVR